MEEKIRNWLTRLNEHNTIPKEIIALNIGIYETANGYCLYMTGSNYFDENDDDWACDAIYKPSDDCLCIPDVNMEWCSFFDKVKEVLANYLSSIKASPNSIFTGKIVTTGFDDGELVRIR